VGGFAFAYLRSRATRRRRACRVDVGAGGEVGGTALEEEAAALEPAHGGELSGENACGAWLPGSPSQPAHQRQEEERGAAVRPGSGDIDGLVRQGGGGGGGVAAGARVVAGAGAGAGRTGADRTTRSKSSIDWEPITLTALVDQKWSPFELFFGPV